jgi:hypothetical protein
MLRSSRRTGFSGRRRVSCSHAREAQPTRHSCRQVCTRRRTAVRSSQAQFPRPRCPGWWDNSTAPASESRLSQPRRHSVMVPIRSSQPSFQQIAPLPVYLRQTARAQPTTRPPSPNTASLQPGYRSNLWRSPNADHPCGPLRHLRAAILRPQGYFRQSDPGLALLARRN